MRAFMVPEFGAAGGVGVRPIPEPAEGEVLVKVKAASVNAMDPVYRSGAFKDFMEHRLPLTPGIDYAGTVTAVGPGVTGISVGDEVFGEVGKAYVGEGSFAEYVTVASRLATPRPTSVSPEQAAALPRAGGTALSAVDAVGGSAGDPIAIVGAAGGVGSLAVQIAAHRGLHVIAVTKGDCAAFVLGLGAAEVVNYEAGDTLEQLLAVAPGGLVGIIDLADDAAGAAALAPAVRNGGRIVGTRVRGIEEMLSDGPVSGQAVAFAADRVGELATLAAAGDLTAPIEVLPLEKAAEAIDRQASRQVRGKLVLAID
jgi:NADPH:quinone reductase-like Zn-dependent oxidoreductase